MGAPEGDDLLLVVLHAVRLVGFAETEVVAGRADLPVERVRRVLESITADGLAMRRDGRMSGWSLTAVGRVHGESLLADELARLGAADAVDDAYRRFLSLNQRFLDLCTDWQLRPSPEGEATLNDHTDAAYDEAVLDRLAAVDEAVQPVVADLADAVARFGPYPGRLGAARALVEAGERDWFTRPVIDSYHTVWFELHEDLLATLGLERTSER